MRLKTTLIVVLLCELTLTACGATTQSLSVLTTQGSAPSGGGNGRETPLALKLALGTFKLDDTAYPIMAEQAKELLPLWKVVRSLSQSDTAAGEEIQAAIIQIQGTITPEQMKAIEDMGLTFRDIQGVANELGLDFGSGGFGNMSPEMQATMQAARESGQGPPPGGGGGPGFFVGGPGEGFNPQARQTTTAGRGGSGGTGLGLPSSLIDAIIKFLEAKIQ